MPELKFTDAELQILARRVVALLPKAKAMQQPRMRILKEAYEQLKKDDPQTSITKSMLQSLVLGGQVPSVMVGQKRLINYDALLDYLGTAHEQQSVEVADYGKIRPIKE